MNYISLGYFCSVAMELERFGLRTMSSPFDWLIVDFKGAIDAIENQFEGFLTLEYLAQSRENRSWYKNLKYQVEFRHEFDQYHSLKSQLAPVQEKYERRIRRFYETIQQPTIFVRYISDEKKIDGKAEELIWIEENFDRIDTDQRSNQDNRIVFIANTGVQSDKIKIYQVEPDPDDAVARAPSDKNSALKDFFESAEVENKEQNLHRYMEQQRLKSRTDVIFKRKTKTLLKKIFLKEYIHEKTF